MPQDVAWRLFASRRRPAELVERVEIEGDQALGGAAIDAVAVMA